MKTVSSLKHKSLTAIFTSLSTIKFGCNPKYTIPYVKVCDNVYLTKWILTSALFIKAHTLLPIQVCFPVSGGLTTFSRNPPRVPSPSHSTQCSYYPASLHISLILSKSSLSFKLGQGSYALSGQQGTWVFFLREKTFTFIIYACRATAQKPERSLLIQF